MKSCSTTLRHKEFPDLTALKAGNGVAWDIAFAHLWPLALRAANRPDTCLLPQEVEEIASDALIEIVSKIEEITDANHAKAFVTMVARRIAINLARKKSTLKRLRPDSPDAVDDQTSSATELNDLERCEMILLLREALDVLDPTTRLIVIEKLADGFTYQEINKRHGIPIGTLCPKVARGLKTVRDQLRESPHLMKELAQYSR